VEIFVEKALKKQILYPVYDIVSYQSKVKLIQEFKKLLEYHQTNNLLLLEILFLINFLMFYMVDKMYMVDKTKILMYHFFEKCV